LRRFTAAAGADKYDEVMEAHCADQAPAYWAQPWPSALALGRWVLEEPSLVAGRSVLELGCGLGLASVCAALAGAPTVLATDLDDDALRFAAANAAANGADERTAFSTRRLDWEAAAAPAPADAPAHERFDVVLCADVLYDEEAPDLLARLLPRVCAEGGVVVRVCRVAPRRRDQHAARAHRAAAPPFLSAVSLKCGGWPLSCSRGCVLGSSLLTTRTGRTDRVGATRCSRGCAVAAARSSSRRANLVQCAPSWPRAATKARTLRLSSASCARVARATWGRNTGMAGTHARFCCDFPIRQLR
jgi:predicted nicotinamide N-methyase